LKRKWAEKIVYYNVELEGCRDPFKYTLCAEGLMVESQGDRNSIGRDGLHYQYSEDRQVVSNGKTIPGLKHKLECDAFTTWTPADVTIATKMGGFARLASTAEYTMQMPTIWYLVLTILREYVFQVQV
jgi:hypothetical protein